MAESGSALCLRLSIPISQPAVAPPADATDEPPHRHAVRYVWALMLARICEVLLLPCPKCGGAMRIVAFITEGPVIRAIPGHLGEPKSPPRLRLAPGPPLSEMPDRGSDTINPQVQLMPEHAFSKRIAW